MKESEAIQQFLKVCHKIMAISHTKGFVGYAKSYAKQILEDRGMWTPEAIVAQIPYLECNLSYWRGAEARKAKLILKEVTKCLR